MNRGLGGFLIGALIVGAAALGWYFYQDSQRSGIDISIGGSGIRIQER